MSSPVHIEGKHSVQTIHGLNDLKKIAQLRLNALLGDFYEEPVVSETATSTPLWYPPKKKFLLFISSTFADTQEERNILQHVVLPELRQKAQVNGVDVNFLDLRAGFPEENAKDNETWTLLEREIVRCYHESGGIFCLSLQASRYGHVPLPTSIDKDVVDRKLKAKADKDLEISAFDDCYDLDTNASPMPVYVLKKKTGDEVRDRQLSAGKDKLKEAFRGLVSDASFPDGLIGNSYTDNEIKKAVALCEPGSHRVQWIRRRFVGDMMDANDPDKLLDDTRDDSTKRAKLDELLAWMEGRLAPDADAHEIYVSVDAFSAAKDDHSAKNGFTFRNYLDNKNDQYTDYHDRFTDCARDVLWASLRDDVMSKVAEWNNDGGGIGMSGGLLSEMMQHVMWAREKCMNFVGREALVKEALGTVLGSAAKRGDETETNGLGGVSLCLVGRSGTGKTALMAKLASEVRRTDPQRRPVIIRFCGTSRGSADGLGLVQSLCHQIQLVFRVEPPQAIPPEYEETVNLLQSLLSQHAVVLFVDSLDQLSDKDQACSKISFLRGVQPHKDTIIVVSTLPDDTDVAIGRGGVAGETDLNGARESRYFFGCDSFLATNHVPRIEVPDFQTDTSSAEEILHTLLARQKRQLTPKQWDKAMASVAVEPTALFLDLAAYVTRKWYSFDLLDSCVLQGGVRGVTEQIFGLLEREFGKQLTRAALGFITWSVEGISDGEMEDLLSLHPSVLPEVLVWIPDVKRLPSHVWLRLRGALKGLVTEHASGCLQWFHRQLSEAAQRRYGAKVDEKQLLHSVMGMYFGNFVDLQKAKETMIRRQPLVLLLSHADGVIDTTSTAATASAAPVLSVGERVIGGPVWRAQAPEINRRRAVEAGEHLLAGGHIGAAVEELCSLETVCARFKAGVGMEVVRMLGQLRRQVTVVKDRERVEHFWRWLLRDGSFLHGEPRKVLSTAVMQPRVSVVRRLAQATAVDTAPIVTTASALTNAPASAASAALGHACATTSPSPYFIRSRVLGGMLNFDALRSVLYGHTDFVTSVAFSRDSSLIVSGSHDETVRVWENETGREVSKLECTMSRVYSVAFSHDSRLIVSGSADNAVRVWKTETGTVLCKLEGHAGEVYSVAFSHISNLIVSGSEDTTVRLWDWETGREVSMLTGHMDWVNSVAFSHDSSLIVSGSKDRQLRVWERETGKEVATLEGHLEAVNSVAFSHNSNLIASGSDDKTVRLWETETGREVAKLEGHSSSVTSLAFSHDSSLVVSGSEDKTVCVWERVTGRVVTKLEGSTSSVTSVALSSDSRMILSGTWDRTVCVWEREMVREVPKMEGHSNWVMSVAFSNDSCLIASGSYDNTVRVWERDTGREVSKLEGHTEAVRSVAFSHDSSLVVSGSEDNTVRVWERETGMEVSKLEGHTEAVRSVAFSNDSSLIVTGSDDKSVRLWERKTGRELSKLEGHGRGVNSVTFSQDSSFIVSGSSDTSVRVWQREIGRQLSKLEGHLYAVKSVAFSHDSGLVVSGSWDGLRVWDRETGKEIRKLKGDMGEVNSVAFSHDSRLIVSGSWDMTVRLWDTETGREVAKLEGHSSSVTSVAFSHDSSLLVSGSEDMTVRVWERVTGRVVTKLQGHTKDAM